ncbi:MAG: hypothetical protein ACJ74O_16915 [Frankiaceae bacterium]
MPEIICVDGSRLGVHPVAVLDRQGLPYEVTLRMTRDGTEFGVVGQRCGYFLDGVRSRLAAARADGSAEASRWPLSDRFPGGSLESGVRAWARDGGRDPADAWSELARYVPRDRELFAFRHRDPDDLDCAGELRCTVRTEKSWEATGGRTRTHGAPVPPHGQPLGQWRLVRRAVVEAWGELGVGVRAVLDSTGLAGFLAGLLGETAQVGAAFDGGAVAAGARTS